MDVFALPASRHNNRGSHSSLTPLTTRMPLRTEDYEVLNSTPNSYLYGMSAPVTPLSEFRPRTTRSTTAGNSNTHRQPDHLAKSKSASHLTQLRTTTGASTPGTRRNGSTSTHRTRHHRRHRTNPPTPSSLLSRFTPELPTTDFLMRMGAIIASEAQHETFGGGLISRASSASLTAAGVPDTPEGYYALQDADEYTLARERFMRRKEEAEYKPPVPRPLSGRRLAETLAASARSLGITPPEQTPYFRGSPRSYSVERRDVNGNGSTIVARVEYPDDDDDYFGPVMMTGRPEDEKKIQQEIKRLAVPDFVEINEPLEEEDDYYYDEYDEQEDIRAEAEDYVRRASKSWFFQLPFVRPFLDQTKFFIAEEDEDEEEEEDVKEEISDEEFERQRQARRSASLRRLQECTIVPLDTTNDPPPQDEDKAGLVSDAAWLFTVASRALWG